MHFYAFDNFLHKHQTNTKLFNPITLASMYLAAANFSGLMLQRKCPRWLGEYRYLVILTIPKA